MIFLRSVVRTAVRTDVFLPSPACCRSHHFFLFLRLQEGCVLEIRSKQVLSYDIIFALLVAAGGGSRWWVVWVAHVQYMNRVCSMMFIFPRTKGCCVDCANEWMLVRFDFDDCDKRLFLYQRKVYRGGKFPGTVQYGHGGGLVL